MAKRGGEVRRSSETKGGVGSHYLFFYIIKGVYKIIYIYIY